MEKMKTLSRPISIWYGRALPICLFFFLILAVEISANVLVAPTSVILSDKQRTGRMTVRNPTNKPVEIEIRFSYGLPVSDEHGNVKVVFQDSLVTDPHSALGWIKAFPKKMILDPNTSQTIRFLARPPKDIQDGEYWARIMVRSQEGQTSIPIPSSREGISTRLNMVMQTAIVIKYRKGDLLSKIEVVGTEVMKTDSSVIAMIDMKNRGNVSYVGTLKCRLLDARNKEISFDRIDLAVYYDLLRRVELPVTEGNFTAPYKVEVSISTDGRTDIPPQDLIIGNKIEYMATVDE